MTSRRSGADRRSGTERRQQDRSTRYAGMGELRLPARREQLLQFLMRYLFAGLAAAFFLDPAVPEPVWLDRGDMAALLLVHAIANTAFLATAWFRPAGLGRFRAAMWLDMAAVTVCVANDPFSVPPSLLAFLMVVLGNGMRYGLRVLNEAVAVAVGGAMAGVAVKLYGDGAMSPAMPFLGIFFALILVYVQILMTRIERSREQLVELPRIDALTGLMNRRALEEAADRVLADLHRRKGRAVLAFADLDNFKQVNDRYGHTTGDEVLRRCAEVLRRSVRQTDIAARFGGDEFVLLLPNLGLDEAEAVARRIQHRVEDWARSSRLDCSISFGLAEAPRHGDTLAQLLAEVDGAMYRSKRPGAPGGVERVGDPLRPALE